MFCGRYVILNAEMGIFFFTPSFRYTSLVRLCPSLAHRLEPSGQQGTTMCWEGEHLSYNDVDGQGGWGVCVCGGGVCSLFPGSFCLRHSPLMRVNEDKLV